MIRNLKIQHFKSLKNLDVELKGLNLLAGVNSSGKSSLIQMLLALRQSINSSQSNVLRLKGDLIELGKGKDILYQDCGVDEWIQVGLKFLNGEPFSRKFNYQLEADYLVDEEKEISSTEKQWYAYYQHLPLFSDNFQYLKTERLGPQNTYEKSNHHVTRSHQIGINGQYAMHYLLVHGNKKLIEENNPLFHNKARSKVLIHQVDAWLGYISPGVKLNITEVPGREMLIADFQFEKNNDYTNRFQPQNVGFGLSYALATILSLLMAKENRLIIIENPEAHLHPSGQVWLGKLMARAAEAGAQLIIETHSDHIINGVRVAVKEKLVAENKAQILFFNRKTLQNEQFSDITPIYIDKQGELSVYPEHFMDEWSNQLTQLLF